MRDLVRIDRSCFLGQAHKKLIRFLGNGNLFLNGFVARFAVLTKTSNFGQGKRTKGCF